MCILRGNTFAIVTAAITATPACTCVPVCVCACGTLVSRRIPTYARVSTSRVFANRDKIYVPKEKRGNDRYISTSSLPVPVHPRRRRIFDDGKR